MSGATKLAFAPFAMPSKGALIAFCNFELKFGPSTRKLLAPAADQIRRAAAAEHFTGKTSSALAISAPEGLKVGKLIIVGTGKADDPKSQDPIKLGGAVMGRVPGRESEVTILAETADGVMEPSAAA